MTVLLASTGRGSSLGGVKLTAEGSASSFEALPAAALAALARADPGGRSGVAAQFTTTLFDPYVDAPLGSGITRLAFATPAGAEVAVANLTVPILFSIPAGPAAGDAPGESGKQMACSFWDAARRVYRCALMRPQPLSVIIIWWCNEERRDAFSSADAPDETLFPGSSASQHRGLREPPEPAPTRPCL